MTTPNPVFVFRCHPKPNAQGDDLNDWTNIIQFNAKTVEAAVEVFEKFIESKRAGTDEQASIYWSNLYEFWQRDGKNIRVIQPKLRPVSPTPAKRTSNVKTQEEMDEENPYDVPEFYTPKARQAKRSPALRPDKGSPGKTTMKAINLALEAAGTDNRVEGANGVIVLVSAADGVRTNLPVKRWSDWDIEKWVSECK